MSSAYSFSYTPVYNYPRPELSAAKWEIPRPELSSAYWKLNRPSRTGDKRYAHYISVPIPTSHSSITFETQIFLVVVYDSCKALLCDGYLPMDAFLAHMYPDNDYGDCRPLHVREAQELLGSIYPDNDYVPLSERAIQRANEYKRTQLRKFQSVFRRLDFRRQGTTYGLKREILRLEPGRDFRAPPLLLKVIMCHQTRPKDELQAFVQGLGGTIMDIAGLHLTSIRDDHMLTHALLVEANRHWEFPEPTTQSPYVFGPIVFPATPFRVNHIHSVSGGISMLDSPTGIWTMSYVPPPPVTAATV